MPLFHYQYLNAKGKRVASHIDANSEGEAKEKLRRQGTLVLCLSSGEVGPYKRWGSKGKAHLTGRNLITFTSQLSSLLLAGVPLYESLLSLEEQARGEPYHPILLSLCDQIKAGLSLSQTMKQFPKSFNSLYCAMVAAGESGGMLDQTLEKLALLIAKQASLRKQFITSLLYPFILMGFSFLVIILLLTFVIPSLEVLFEDRSVNGFTSCVIGLSHLLTRGWKYYLPLLGMALFAARLFLHSKNGALFIQKMLLKTPLLKTVIIHAALSRFCRTMGTLLQGGVTILQAMQIARQVMRNPFLESVIEESEKRIVEGSLLSIEWRKSPLIPSLATRMVAVGEEGGNLALMLQKIADVYEEETEKTLARLTALAQPIILLVMGVIVGVIMLAVLLPLTDINAFLT